MHQDARAFVDEFTIVGSSPSAAPLQEYALAAAVIVERVFFVAGLRLNVSKMFLLMRPAGPGDKSVEKQIWARSAHVNLPSGEPLAIRRTIKCLGTLVSDKDSMGPEVCQRTARARAETRPIQRVLKKKGTLSRGLKG